VPPAIVVPDGDLECPPSLNFKPVIYPIYHALVGENKITQQVERVDIAVRCMEVNSDWKRVRVETDLVAPQITMGALKEPSMMRVAEASKGQLNTTPNPLLHTPLPLAIYFFTKNWSKSVVHGPDPFKDALKRPSPPFHPPSQPHIMMVACSPNCCTPLLMTTLCSPLCAYPMFATKFKGKAPILKQWVDKMGGSAACRQIGSNTSYGEG
jgi:hypothetical protein